jgi:hypothetical protein
LTALAAFVALAPIGWAASVTPAFYRDRVAEAVTPGTEQAARRLVTKLAALQAAAEQSGRWDTALSEDEINGWLAFDLPRNHPLLLPANLAAPRVALATERVQAAAVRRFGPLSGIVSLEIELRLRPPGVIECAVADARLGAIPLPRGPWLHWLAARLTPLGLPTDFRRGSAGSVLEIVLPAVGPRPIVLDALAIDAGELLLAGRTGEPRGGVADRRPGGPPDAAWEPVAGPPTAGTLK